MSTHATQTMPPTPANLNTPEEVAAQSNQGLGASQPSNAQKQPTPQAAPPKKTRRRPAAKEYLIAARQRREQQQWQNYQHPVPRESQWTCEFCEYEQIFGTPPVALIKQYEIKDRQARKQEAERRRLLEKAKMKGRKGRKGSKATPKAAPAPQQTQQAQQSASMEPSQYQDQGTQSEEYYEDEYDEEYAQDYPPPPSLDGQPLADQGEPVRTDPGRGDGAGSTMDRGT